MNLQTSSRTAILTRPFDNGIVTSIERALLNCMEAHEVLDLLKHYYNSDAKLRTELLKRLKTIVDDDAKQLDIVRAGVEWFLSVDEGNLTYGNRSGLDATVGRLAQLLLPIEQVKLAPRFLMHARAARRRTGALMVGMHAIHCPVEMAQILLEAFERRRDPEVLTPFSRIHVELTGIAPMLLDALAKLHDPQGINRQLREQARVIECLLATNLMYAVEFADHYPGAFLYASGRIAQVDALPHVMRILALARERHARALRLLGNQLVSGSHSSVRLQVLYKSKQEDADTVRLGIWALERLRDRSDLQDLAREYGIEWLAANETNE